MPCKPTGAITCASKNETRSFFDNHKFMISTLDNFVDMETVKNYGNHISQAHHPIEFTALDPDQSSLLFVDLEEHRVGLQDYRFDFIGLQQSE